MDPIEVAKRAWAEHFGASQDEVYAVDMQEWYAWATEHRIVAAWDMQRSRPLYMAVTKQGEVLVFGDPNNLDAFNRFWDAEDGALPDALPAVMFAEVLRSFLGSTRAQIGSPDHLDEEKPRLRGWLKHEDDVARFKKYCAEPVIEDDGKRWELRFFAINDAGEVEAWTVTGDRDALHRASFTSVEPEGTFFYPYV